MNKADSLKYKALKQAIEIGDAKIALYSNNLNKPNSPIYNPWELLLPILAPTLLGLILILTVGVIVGLLLMAAMIVISNTYVKKHLQTRLVKRAKDYMLSGYENMQNIWAYGTIIIINAADTKNSCIAPDGNWKDFVILNFADYMANKNKKED